MKSNLQEQEQNQDGSAIIQNVYEGTNESVGEKEKRSGLQEIRTVYNGLETLYQTYLPKVDPILVHDLLVRELEKSERAPFYMVEVFTKKGTDSEWCKDHIWNTTGFVPAVYDKGTHYVTNMRLTLEALKTLQDFDFVLEVTGDYTGTLTGRGASHESTRAEYLKC